MIEHEFLAALQEMQEQAANVRGCGAAGCCLDPRPGVSGGPALCTCAPLTSGAYRVAAAATRLARAPQPRSPGSLPEAMAVALDLAEERGVVPPEIVSRLASLDVAGAWSEVGPGCWVRVALDGRQAGRVDSSGAYFMSKTAWRRLSWGGASVTPYKAMQMVDRELERAGWVLASGQCSGAHTVIAVPYRVPRGDEA